MIVGSDPGRSAEAVAGSNQLDEVVKPEKMAKIEQPSKQLDRVVKPEMKTEPERLESEAQHIGRFEVDLK